MINTIDNNTQDNIDSMGDSDIMDDDNTIDNNMIKSTNRFSIPISSIRVDLWRVQSQPPPFQHLSFEMAMSMNAQFVEFLSIFWRSSKLYSYAIELKVGLLQMTGSVI